MRCRGGGGGGGGGGLCFGLLVNARAKTTALPYKTWISAEA